MTKYKLKGDFTCYKVTTIINSTSKMGNSPLQHPAFREGQKRLHQHIHGSPTVTGNPVNRSAQG